MSLPAPPVNMTGMTDLVTHINGITEGWFGLSFLVMIGAISFLSVKESYDKALGISSLLVMFCAIILRMLEMISGGVLVGCIIIFILAVLNMMQERHREEGNV